MRHVIDQIQDLLEGLESLRTEQKLILHRNEMQDDQNLQNLPSVDLGIVRRILRL